MAGLQEVHHRPHRSELWIARIALILSLLGIAWQAYQMMHAQPSAPSACMVTAA